MRIEKITSQDAIKAVKSAKARRPLKSSYKVNFDTDKNRFVCLDSDGKVFDYVDGNASGKKIRNWLADMANIYEADLDFDQDILEDLNISPVKSARKPIKSMFVTREISLTQFEPWSGAVSTYDRIMEEGKDREFEALIDELYPDGIDETQLNDILWFDEEWVYEMLGITDEDNDEDDEEEEIESACHGKGKKKARKGKRLESSVTLDDDDYIDLLWDRVESSPYGDCYDDDFWEACFDYFKDVGFPGVSPMYFIDNVAVNGDICHVDDAPDNYDEINAKYDGDVEKWADDNGYPIIADHVVVSWGL